ncbi:MAG: hypothetical protein LUQ22_01300 [Methanotrichaceae archaeon]|nr:hypothetical protein [Methanotrichaceae archaeon]
MADQDKIDAVVTRNVTECSKGEIEVRVSPVAIEKAKRNFKFEEMQEDSKKVRESRPQ